jgi:hypothetical protein
MPTSESVPEFLVTSRGTLGEGDELAGSFPAHEFWLDTGTESYYATPCVLKSGGRFNTCPEIKPMAGRRNA